MSKDKKIFLSSVLLLVWKILTPISQHAFARQGQQETRMNGEAEGGEGERIIWINFHHLCICCLVSWCESWVTQTDRDVTEKRISRHHSMKGRLQSMVAAVSDPWSVPGLGRITSTDGAVAHVARLAGAQVSSDGVGADGVLVAQILATGALVVLWGGQRGTFYLSLLWKMTDTSHQ